MFTKRMHEKLRRVQGACVASAALLTCASAAVMIIVTREPPAVQNDDARVILPLTLLVFLACTIGAVCLSIVHRSQSLSRVAGMRRDGATDLLLPMYANLNYFRCVLLVIPSFAGIFAFMFTGRPVLMLIPAVCIALLVFWVPARWRFEKWVEDAIAFV